MLRKQGLCNHQRFCSSIIIFLVVLVRLACISYPCGVHRVQQQMDGWMVCVYGCVCACVGVGVGVRGCECGCGCVRVSVRVILRVIY